MSTVRWPCIKPYSLKHTLKRAQQTLLPTPLIVAIPLMPTRVSNVSLQYTSKLRANSIAALTPFHKTASGDFWTSANSRNIRDMGYTYPELSNNPSNATLVASIKAQYSGPADVPVTNAKSKRQDPQPTKKTLYLAEAKLPLYGLDDGAGGGSPYNLLVFLGNVSSHSAEWLLTLPRNTSKL